MVIHLIVEMVVHVNNSSVEGNEMSADNCSIKDNEESGPMMFTMEQYALLVLLQQNTAESGSKSHATNMVKLTNVESSASIINHASLSAATYITHTSWILDTGVLITFVAHCIGFIHIPELIPFS